MLFRLLSILTLVYLSIAFAFALVVWVLSQDLATAVLVGLQWIRIFTG